MTPVTEVPTGAPLTILSEEEQMFQQSVRDFAIEKVRPLVHQMDHDASMSKDLISSFFELGIMGIEVPDQWGGAGSTVFIVFANANPNAGYKGITAFLIERDFPGFSVGKREDKTGIRASSTCELLLEDCRVPKENVVGEAGKGY